MSFCSKCGTKNDDDVVFCTFCGTKLGENAASTSTPPASLLEQKPAPTQPLQPVKKGKLGYILLAILIFLMSGCWALVQFKIVNVNFTFTGFGPTFSGLNQFTATPTFFPETSPTIIPGDSQLGNQPSATLLMNSTYGFSIDAGQVAERIENVIDERTPDTEAYYVYCYTLQPGDVPNSLEDECGPGALGIFIIQVLNTTQFTDYKAAGADAFGQVLSSQKGLYFIYEHLNGDPPKSIPTGFFEKVATSFRFESRATTDGPPPKLTDPNAQFLDTIVKLTGINFSDITPKLFSWWSGTWETMIEHKIQGFQIKASNVPEAQFIGIDNFFLKEGYILDEINIADGTVSGRSGYKKGNQVCQLYTGITGGEEAFANWDQGQPTFYDIEILCGVLTK